jgi:hypothetical protein
LFKGTGYTINMEYGQATSLYANQSGESNSPGTHSVFLNTPSGEMKLPEYAYSQITTNLKSQLRNIRHCRTVAIYCNYSIEVNKLHTTSGSTVQSEDIYFGYPIFILSYMK